MAFLLRQRPKVFPTYAKIESEVGPDLPVILREESVVVVAEKSLGRGWAASPRVRVNLVKERRAIGEVEKSAKGEQRPRPPDQVVVVLLLSPLAAEAQAVIAGRLSQSVAYLKSVFSKDTRRSF